MPDTVAIERYDLHDDGQVPNNPTLPLQVYRAALPTGASAEQRIMAHFAARGWSNAWINGIYPYHHYHATAHEVLGIARGSAKVQFGGAQGPIAVVTAGDAVLIPAGVGHCRIEQSADLSVIGAYPGGVDPDLQRAGAAARIASLPLIARVARWARDPIVG